MTAFKCVRPDGTDFRTGTILYEVGKTVSHPASKKMVPNEPETYLSVSVEKADCTRFQWPCRLFKVQTVGKTLDGLEASKNKRACLKLKVLEEFPAWEAFGPNGEAVAALIERAKTITPEQARELGAASDAAWNVAWHTAWDAAWVAAWVAARDAARVAAWDAAIDAARDAARGAAWVAARDAAIALVAKDLITQDKFNTLYGPWKAVMEKE